MSLYNIQFDDVLGSYKLRKELHRELNEAFNAAGKVYGGRSFFTEFDLSGYVKTLDFGGAYDTVMPTSSDFAFDPHRVNVKGQDLPLGVHGLYKKLDAEGVKIQKEVLEKFYATLYKETEKQLLDKFDTYNLDDLTKGIMLSKELIYDVKKAKTFAEDGRKIVERAVKSFKKELKNKYKMMDKDSYMLSMDQLINLGKTILGRATELCPIETGFLRSSGTLYVFKDYIKILYRCPYAVYVHENINATHPFGQAKFLETAAQEILTTKFVYIVIDDVSGEYANFEWIHYGSGKTSKDAYLVRRDSYKTIMLTVDRNLIVNRSGTI